MAGVSGDQPETEKAPESEGDPMATVVESDKAAEKQEAISAARHVISVKRVYGDPYEKNGLAVIPAAIVGGVAASASGDQTVDESGERACGLMARPSGAWIIQGDQVTWKPAIDVNRIVLGGQIIAFTAIFMAGRILLARSSGSRSKPSLAGTVAGALAKRLLARGQSKSA
jgi:hypothetical protein